MFNLFKFNSTSKLIQHWSEKVSAFIKTNDELKTKIDQVGIINGEQIITDFIDNNENGLAYAHLIYMIQEFGVYLEDEQIQEILQLANKVGFEAPDLFAPSLIEIEEFYRLLSNFNQVQQKVIEILTEIWNMESPMTRDKWIGWSQKQYEEHEFKNEKRLRIFPHGYGLSYQDSEISIDFDFGEHGETNGFDVGRIWFFTETNKIKTLIRDEKQIKRVVAFETDSENLSFSGYINYYEK